jgi:hypothetical protein
MKFAVPPQVNVYLSARPEHALARQLLELSILRHTDVKVNFLTANAPQEVPARQHFEGRAIYLDAASVVLADIWDLWTQPEQQAEDNAIDNAAAWLVHRPAESYVDEDGKAHPRYTASGAVVLFLCERCRRDNGDVLVTAAADTRWNMTSHHAGVTRLLHYEDGCPWLHPEVDSHEVWQHLLTVAMQGCITQETLEDAVKKGYFHPDYLDFRRCTNRAKHHYALQPGQIFGLWTVLGFSASRRGRTYWSCRCACGKSREVCGVELCSGRSQSCGCRPTRPAHNYLDIQAGQKFGDWTVRGFAYNREGRSYWRCLCKCGTIRDVCGCSLRRGSSLSCGCRSITGLPKPVKDYHATAAS